MRVGDNAWLTSQSTKLGRGTDRPLSLEERDIKFMDCIQQNYPEDQALDLPKKLRALDQLTSVVDLTTHLR